MRTTTHVRCLFGVATLACAGLLLAATPALAGAGDAIELRRYRDLLDPHRLDCPRGTNLVVEDEGEGVQEVCLSAGGLRHGYFLRWHDDGHTWAELGKYQAGRRHGRWMVFDREGRTRLVRFYSHGQLRRERVL